MWVKCFPMHESPLIFPYGNIFSRLCPEILFFRVFTAIQDFFVDHQHQPVLFIFLFLIPKGLQYSHCKSQAISVTQLSNISTVIAGILFFIRLISESTQSTAYRKTVIHIFSL